MANFAFEFSRKFKDSRMNKLVHKMGNFNRRTILDYRLWDITILLPD